MASLVLGPLESRFDSPILHLQALICLGCDCVIDISVYVSSHCIPDGPSRTPLSRTSSRAASVAPWRSRSRMAAQMWPTLTPLRCERKMSTCLEKLGEDWGKIRPEN